jgi:hypothetical protein
MCCAEIVGSCQQITTAGFFNVFFQLTRHTGLLQLITATQLMVVNAWYAGTLSPFDLL